MESQQIRAPMEGSIGRLHPELRDVVLNANLWVGSIGGICLLGLSLIGQKSVNLAHPALWVLIVLHVLMLALAFWRKAPIWLKSVMLANFCFTWCLIVIAYVGPSALVALLLVYCSLMAGFVYGTRGVVACVSAMLGLFSLSAYAWHVGIFPPQGGSYRGEIHHPKYWIDTFFAMLLGIGLIFAVIHFLMRRMAQYFNEEATILRTLSREQQYRAQAELNRLRSELAQREAEQALATMLRAAPIGFAHSRERRIQRVNKGLCDMLGYTEEELIDSPTRMLFADEEEYQHIGAELARLVENKVLRQEVAGVTKSGRRIQVLITASILNPGNPDQGYVVTALDVTESRASQNALKESESRLREIFDHTNDVIYSVGVMDSGEYVFENINKAAERYGYHLASITLGRIRLRDYFEGSEAGAIEAAFGDCVRRRVPTMLEQNIRLPTGEFRFRTTLVPVVDAGGQRVVRLIGLAHDMTAEHRISELQNEKVAADAANRAKSAFLSNMSHEIRTPLNAILGFTRLLLRDPQLEGRQREFLGIVDRNGEHLLNLINDILEISKIEASKVELRVEPFSAAELCHDLIATFKAKAALKEISLRLELPPELPVRVVGDEGKVRQILLNLIGNALKFTERGEVVLTVSMKGEGSGTLLEFSVRDTGPGISRQDAEKLFQNFEQTDVGRRVGGTGLGLAISRNYARLMKGDVGVESAVGKGSVFKVWIPLRVPEASAPADRQQRENEARFRLKPSSREVRILIVDDSADSRMLMKAMLGNAGFSTRETGDGIEALGLADSWKPHCVITDLKMPGMDGETALRHLRAKYSSSELKVIILSASVFLEDDQQYLKDGADAFLPKPVREKEIYDTLRGLLSLEFETESEPAMPLTASPDVKFNISTKLARELILASEEADFGRLQDLVHQVRLDDSSTALTLDAHLAKFDYEAIRVLARPFLRS